MWASNSVTRSTLARKLPPGRARICAPGEHQRARCAASVRAAPHQCCLGQDVNAVRVTALLVAHGGIVPFSSRHRRIHELGTPRHRPRPAAVLLLLHGGGPRPRHLQGGSPGDHRQRGVRALLPRADEHAGTAGGHGALDAAVRRLPEPLLGGSLGRGLPHRPHHVLPWLREIPRPRSWGYGVSATPVLALLAGASSGSSWRCCAPTARAQAALPARRRLR